MSDEKIHILQKALERERLARKEAEKILEQKSLELFEKTEELASINENLSKVIDEQTIEFNDIFDNIIDSYILMDLHGNVLKMNEPATKFFGYNLKKEKFNVTEIIYEGDYEYAYESFYKLIEIGHFENYQARIYTKSGEIKWVQINSRIIRDGETEPRFAHGIVRDITEAKERQEAFEAQKQQLDAIVDNSSLGIVLTKKGRVLKSNKAFQEIIEYSEEELIGMTVGDVSMGDDEELSYMYLNKLLTGELEEFTVNKRYMSKKGKIIWAKTSVAAVRDPDGSIKYEVALVEDITEELKQGALLEALNNLMSSILGKTNIYEIAWEITKNTIGLLGFEDCVIYLLDKEKNELNQIAAYGEKVSSDNEILNQIAIPLGKGIVGTVAKTGKAEIIADTSKDNRYIVDDKLRFSEIAVPIIANEEIIGVIDSEHTSKNFFTEDHLKTLQTIASLAATQLKNALSLRLREKAEKEKELVLKDLQKSNQELNDFAHVVSHDLKSPLRSMNTLVNWLKEDSAEFANEEINQNFELLLKRVDRMDLLINGILNYASIDKVEKINKKIDIQNIVDDILEGIHIPENFIVKVAEKLPVIKGDSYKLIQLFQNLISNAIKYCDKEKGLIEINCNEEKKHWKFSISDNGKGIPKKYHEKIFQVFQVLEESEDSTGVGLSIVKKIIDFYEGEIWLTSKVDIGTTFYFTLPK
ncbi:PAS domain S-box protein [Pseudotenacibaculum sp. MALMAid0570]|uniref:PAS domain-containing sensor histidine kinase n=1 Tax=Pseudotenacibaculum sp. MALMAid0570 TaxID=3143938 RepID=UPI0032DE8360